MSHEHYATRSPLFYLSARARHAVGRHVGTRGLLSLLAGGALLLATSEAGAAFNPDLKPTKIQGPSSAVVGQTANVTVGVASIGTYYSGKYTYEIRLSTNSTITSSDKLLMSKTTQGYGTFPLIVTVPTSVSPGTYYWGIIVKPIPGEQLTSNNRLAGNTVQVSKIDLHAVSINGPMSVDAGDQVVLTRNIKGQGFSGSFTYDIRLSKDKFASSDDLKFTIQTSSHLGTSQVGGVVSKYTPPGKYYWIMKIWDHPSESDTSNNEVAGNLVTVVAPPDLYAKSVSGLPTAYPGDQVSVNRKIENLGGSFSGNFQLEIRLSTDPFISASDKLLKSQSSGFVGSSNLLVNVPGNMPYGDYYWGLIVQPVAGEVETSNNWVAGNKITIKQPGPPPAADLCLDSTQSIIVNHSAGGSMPGPFDRYVENCGDSGTQLSWQLQGLGPSWISASDASGSLSGGSQQKISLYLDPNGLAPGQYQTELKFVNMADSQDYETIDVTLSVSTPTFEPGDYINGAISSPGAQMILGFDAVKGMKLKLKVKSLDPGMKLKVRVLKPNGSEIDNAILKKKGKKSKTEIKLKKTGPHLLEITSAKGLGSFSIKSSAKYKKTKKSMLSGDQGAQQGHQFMAPAGAILDVDAVATRHFEGSTLILVLRDDQGREVHQASGDCGVAEITELVVPETGRYVLTVDGIEGKKAVRLSYTVELPGEGVETTQN